MAKKPCRGCGGMKTTRRVRQPMASNSKTIQNLIRVVFLTTESGLQQVTGSSGRQYGRRTNGDVFYVLKSDLDERFIPFKKQQE